MILTIDKNMSLGDFIMCTGLPNAFYKVFGEKTYITNKKMPLLWENNPFLLEKPEGKEYNLVPNSPRDYMIYYPVRAFFDMTGLIVNRNIVHPMVYYQSDRTNTILVNDQAGWPSRVGYPYLNELLKELRKQHTIKYIRYPRFTNCYGKRLPATVTEYDVLFENLGDNELLQEMASCAFYIGYDSGLSQLAGALGTPYIALQSAVPPINTCHNSCIYHTEICAGYCRAEKCEKMCMQNAPNINDEILNGYNNWL